MVLRLWHCMSLRFTLVLSETLGLGVGNARPLGQFHVRFPCLGLALDPIGGSGDYWSHVFIRGRGRCW